jgi:23S rRNA (cytosine1962-C5)-methyltransferase
MVKTTQIGKILMIFFLEQAWATREKQRVFTRSQAVRVFHGPGEGKGDLKSFALDRFGDHYWVTEWENSWTQDRFQKVRDQIVDFLKQKGALSIVGLTRPEKGVAHESYALWGRLPTRRFEVKENDVFRFWIQFEKVRHPGLFLDHEPLRRWLKENVNQARVLNAFAYTGSLSVAAAIGNAKAVTTLDLSKPVIQWATENFILNRIQLASHRFIAGDVFEWLPRLKREGQLYDCIILDPPSFSQSKKTGRFSTSKDLEKLHVLAMELLAENGVLITSINSANVSWKKYESDIVAAAQKNKMAFSVIQQIDLPETFPTQLGESASRYLKGWILRRILTAH